MKLINRYTVSNQILIALGLFVLLFGTGFFVGINYKKCPQIVTTTTTHDTTYIRSSPIEVEKITYKPITKTIKEVKTIVKNNTDTQYIYNNWASVDTQRFNKIGISIKDNGNELGINERTVQWFGSIDTVFRFKEIETIKTIAPPTKLLSTYVGVGNLIRYSNSGIKITDIGAEFSLLYKNKAMLDAGYYIGTNQIKTGLKIKL